MKRIRVIIGVIFFVFCTFHAFSEHQEGIPTYSDEIITYIALDSIHGKTGNIKFGDANCMIRVPKGFVFIDREDAMHLLNDYWNNPEESDALAFVYGALVKDTDSIYAEIKIAYTITYETTGHIFDKDAESIDYDNLLKSMRNDLKKEADKNPTGQRWELIGWAWEPKYDNINKVLSWARHFRHDGKDVLNYDIRVLGKEGVVKISAVADFSAKSELIANKDIMSSCIEFDEGYRYSDYKENTDQVPQMTIESLIDGAIRENGGSVEGVKKITKYIFVIIGLIFYLYSKRKKILKFMGYHRDDEYDPT